MGTERCEDIILVEFYEITKGTIQDAQDGCRGTIQAHTTEWEIQPRIRAETYIVYFDIANARTGIDFNLLHLVPFLMLVTRRQ